jgi:hypothetical protein
MWLAARTLVYDWSGLERGFSSFGLDWGMSPTEVSESCLGERPLELEDSAWIDVVAYGLPWAVELSFTEDGLGAISMAHFRQLSQRPSLKRHPSLDRALLELPARGLFEHLRAILRRVYGAPSESTNDAATAYCAWEARSTSTALELPPEDSAADLYLWLTPAIATADSEKAPGAVGGNGDGTYFPRK